MERRISDIRRIIEKTRGDMGVDCRSKITEKLAPIDEGFIYHVDRDYLSLHDDLSIIQNLSEIMDLDENKRKKVFQSPIKYNTYPFGQKSDDYPRFLAVCLGTMKLDTVLKEAIRRSKIIKTKFENCEDTKTVIIVTDKWDYNSFSKYEKEFLEYAINDDIWYIFLLVTDYGYTEIPFLPYQRNSISELKGSEVLDDISDLELIDLLGNSPIIYEESSVPLNTTGYKKYTIDLYDWSREDLIDSIINGKTDSKEFVRFLRENLWICQQSEKLIERIGGIDGKTMTLQVFGKTIKWDSVACDDDSLQNIKMLQLSINKLINKCEKRINIG